MLSAQRATRSWGGACCSPCCATRCGEPCQRMAMEKMPKKLPLAGDAAPGTEGDWSTLVGRAIDDVSRIIQSEIGLLETTLRAVVEEQTDYALANLAAVAVMICAAICMLG